VEGAEEEGGGFAGEQFEAALGVAGSYAQQEGDDGFEDGGDEFSVEFALDFALFLQVPAGTDDHHEGVGLGRLDFS
jgi:hypothetical protein